jgi:hypothetical protein
METEDQIQRVLDHIDQDKIVSDDPYFSARLMARTQDYFSPASSRSRGVIMYRLRPLLAAAILMIGVFAGIMAGMRLNRIPAPRQAAERDELIRQFTQENYISELNNSVEEQILSSK